MSKPRVYIHRAAHWYPLFMDAHNEAALRAFADVVTEPDAGIPLSATHLTERLRGVSAILSLNGHGSEDITPAVLDASGVDLICIAHSWGQFARVPAGVRVIEGSNAGTLAVAEWIVTAALMGVRGLHEFDRRLKAGSPWGEPRRSVGLLAGGTVGLIGLGRIGRAAAASFRALGANVRATSTSCTSADAEALGVELMPLDALLATSDVISLQRAVAPETKGKLGAREFRLIKTGAVFINAARAALYDEKALIAELRTGRFSAFIDVFETEPIPLDHPFRSLPNVVITPHIAGNNTAMFQRCAREAIATMKSYLTRGVYA